MYHERLTSKVINKRLINSFFIARERDLENHPQKL